MLGGLFGFSRYIATEPIALPQQGPSHDSRALEMRVDALELACAGLWRLLREHHGYTDEQLVDWIEHVDAEDGKSDGRRTVRADPCPQCNRPALARAKGKCLWCGAEVKRTPL